MIPAERRSQRTARPYLEPFSAPQNKPEISMKIVSDVENWFCFIGHTETTFVIQTVQTNVT